MNPLGVRGSKSALASQTLPWCVCIRLTLGLCAQLGWDGFFFRLIFSPHREAAVESWQVCRSWLAVWGLCHYSGHLSSEQEFCVSEIMYDQSTFLIINVLHGCDMVFLMALTSLIGMPMKLNIVKVFICGRKVFKICNTRYKCGRRKCNMNVKLALCTWMASD